MHLSPVRIVRIETRTNEAECWISALEYERITNCVCGLYADNILLLWEWNSARHSSIILVFSSLTNDGHLYVQIKCNICKPWIMQTFKVSLFKLPGVKVQSLKSMLPNDCTLITTATVGIGEWTFIHLAMMQFAQCCAAMRLHEKKWMLRRVHNHRTQLYGHFDRLCWWLWCHIWATWIALRCQHIRFESVFRCTNTDVPTKHPNISPTWSLNPHETQVTRDKTQKRTTPHIIIKFSMGEQVAISLQTTSEIR